MPTHLLPKCAIAQRTTIKTKKSIIDSLYIQINASSSMVFQFIVFDFTSLSEELLSSLPMTGDSLWLPELAAAMSFHQVFRFSLSGRTGSGFHITCAGTGSFRNSSFFIITQTGLFIASGLGDLRAGKAGGHMLQGLLMFAVRLPSDQLKPEGYSGLLLYNKANSVANFESSGCRKG